jgi:hypothetical protein
MPRRTKTINVNLTKMLEAFDIADPLLASEAHRKNLEILAGLGFLPESLKHREGKRET